MTREEREQAIAILENEKKCVNRANKNDYCNRDCYNCELVKTDTEILTALDMAIKALEQEPAYCDRNICIKNEYNGIGCKDCEVTKSQEPKTGHWIEEDVFDGDIAYRCSECNELFWLEDGTPKDNGYNFCPNCGARMVEPSCDTCEYNTAAFNPCNACKDKSEYKPKESEKV